MILTSLHMYRINKDSELKGKMTVSGNTGEIALVLNDKTCAMIVELMRGGMQNVLDEVANGLLNEVNAKPVAIEGKP